MHSNYLLAVIMFLGVLAGTTAVVAQESQWDSNFNRMYLSQHGSKITGSYDYHGGKITANITGYEMYGWWSENDDLRNCGPNKIWSGPFVLVFAQDMQSFTGRYGKCSEGKTDFNGLDGDWRGTLVSGALSAYSTNEVQLKPKSASKKVLPRKSQGSVNSTSNKKNASTGQDEELNSKEAAKLEVLNGAWVAATGEEIVINSVKRTIVVPFGAQNWHFSMGAEQVAGQKITIQASLTNVEVAIPSGYPEVLAKADTASAAKQVEQFSGNNFKFEFNPGANGAGFMHLTWPKGSPKIEKRMEKRP